MDVTEATGPFGRFQYKLLAIVCFRAICGAFVGVIYQLTSFTAPHYCQDDQADWQNSESQCTASVWSNVTTNYTSVSCTSWTFNSTAHESIVEEWSLVCDRAWIVSFGYMIKALGNFAFYIPAGQLADKLGRKPLALVGNILCLILVLLTIFSNGPVVFMVFRFLVGLAYAIAQNPMLCLYLESVGPKYRDSVVLSFSGSWGIGIWGIALLAYFVPQWRYVTLIAALLLQLPFVLLIWGCVDESARWLLTEGRYEEAKTLIIKHAKENRKELLDPDAVVETLKKKLEKDNAAHKPNFFELWRNRNLRMRTVMLYLVLLMVVFVYHGFIISVGRLYGNLYLNIAMIGVIEVIIVPFYYIIVKFFDRRRGLLTCFVLSGLTFLLTLAVPLNLGWLKTALAMIGRSCNALSYILLYVYVAELFPTNLRTVALSGAMSSGRIGGMIAPFTDVLGRMYGDVALNTMYGTLSLITSVVFFFLPETRNTNLPDTVAQSEKLKARIDLRGDDNASKLELYGRQHNSKNDNREI